MNILFAIVLSSLLAACSSFGPSHDRRDSLTINRDHLIEEQADERLSKLNAVDERARIRVTAHNGVVLLSGEVSHESLRQPIINSIRTLPGIKLLHNGLLVAKPASEKIQANDQAITERIVTKLEQDKQLPAFATDQIKIVTEQGVVFLLGLVNQQEGKVITEVTQTVPGIHKVVQLFEYLDEMN